MREVDARSDPNRCLRYKKLSVHGNTCGCGQATEADDYPCSLRYNQAVHLSHPVIFHTYTQAKAVTVIKLRRFLLLEPKHALLEN